MKRICGLVAMICSVCLLISCRGGSDNVENPSADKQSVSQTAEIYADILRDYKTIVYKRLSTDWDNNSQGILLPSYVKFNETDDTQLYDGVPLSMRWSNMIIEMTSGMSAPQEASFGYILWDMNADDVPELFWVKEDYSLLAIFTYYEDTVVLLDAFWPRYQGVITDNGELYTRGSGGATYTYFLARSLTKERKWERQALFGIDGWNEEAKTEQYIEWVNGEKTVIDKARFETLLAQRAFVNGAEWTNGSIEQIG